MKKALTTTAAALLALSAHAQTASSTAGTGSTASGSVTGSSALQPSARPTVNPDGPLGAFYSQDSIRVESPTSRNRVGGPVGVTTRPPVEPVPGSTTSIDQRNATRPGFSGPSSGLSQAPIGLTPRDDLDATLPREAINDSSRWELDVPEGAVGAPGTGAFQTGTSRSIPSAGGAPRVATGALPPAVLEDTARPNVTENGLPAPRTILNQAGGASTTDSTTVVENGARADARTTAGSSADLNTTGIAVPPAVPERPLDRALSAKIRSRLSETGTAAEALSPAVVRDLRITSQNGRVTLEGTVTSDAEKRAIEMRARQVAGVGDINNRLQVRGQGTAPAAPSPTFKPSSGAPASSEAGAGASVEAENDLDLDDRHSEILPPP